MTIKRTKEHWDYWWMGLAKYVSSASKDPSTQVGAVIVDTKNRLVSVGYNGFARGLPDDPEKYVNREWKYKLIIHAEENAILFAGRDITGYTLYTYPFMSCSKCARIVIQSGITRHVFPLASGDIASRWSDEMFLSEAQFRDGNVELVCLTERI